MSKPAFPSYFRKPEIVECTPIMCFCCNQPMVRYDQNRYKLILSCVDCNITIQMKTNEVILYKEELMIHKGELDDSTINNDNIEINNDNIKSINQS